MAKVIINVSPIQHSQTLTAAVLQQRARSGAARAAGARLLSPTAASSACSTTAAGIVTEDEPKLTVLRLVDRGELVAQCNISPLPKLEKPIPLAEFQRDVERSLGKNFGKFVAAGQTINETGYAVFRVVVHGEVGGLPIEWIYYLVQDRTGKRVSLCLHARAKPRRALCRNRPGPGFRPHPDRSAVADRRQAGGEEVAQVCTRSNTRLPLSRHLARLTRAGYASEVIRSPDVIWSAHHDSPRCCCRWWRARRLGVDQSNRSCPPGFRSSPSTGAPGRFAPLEPRKALLWACTHHDDGWREWDRFPASGSDHRRAAAVPRDAPGRNTRHLDQVDRRRRRAGTSGGLPGRGALLPPGPPRNARQTQRSGLATVRRFLDDYEARSQRWLCPLASRPRARADSRRGRTALDQLQFFDTFSLWFCCSESTEREIVETPAGIDLEVSPRGISQIRLSPWPLTVDMLELSAAGRLVEARQYADADELAAAPSQAITLRWRLSPA